MRSYKDKLPLHLKTKYNAALKSCGHIIRSLPEKRPNCEEIIERKDWWALNKELEISDELEDIIASKEHENEFTIYWILRSEINLI